MKKINPKRRRRLSPEQRLLKAIFAHEEKPVKITPELRLAVLRKAIDSAKKDARIFRSGTRAGAQVRYWLRHYEESAAKLEKEIAKKNKGKQK